MSDIIDRIDELVDASLAEGESCSDYLNNDPEYPRCPHCNRHWHGLRITQRIEDMRYRGRFDEDYSIATDDSAVLCEGSNFIGPPRPPATWSSSLGLMPGWSFLGYTDDAPVTYPRRDLNFTITIEPRIGGFRDGLRQALHQFQFPAYTLPRWTLYDGNWNVLETSEPEPACTPPPDIEVKFGPQNWHCEFQRIPNHSSWTYVITPNTRAVARLWDEFTALEHPMPKGPGLDIPALEATITAVSTGPALPPLGRAS